MSLSILNNLLALSNEHILHEMYVSWWPFDDVDTHFTAMAYAILATLPAVYGLYVAFFSVLVYAVLGTSKHTSIGEYEHDEGIQTF